jgi:hypothetical protein
VSVTCQLCGESHTMSRVLSLGYMPPPNDMPMVENYDPKPQTWLPTEMWYCSSCELAQLGYVPDQTVAFPEDYPYTSSATPALRRNFEDLAKKCIDALNLDSKDLVVDIGSNDGTLLSCFGYQNVLGIEPTAAAYIAQKSGIRTDKCWFTREVARYHVEDTDGAGKAKLITCTNCFAHMPNIHDVIDGIKLMLADDGMFVSESHYLIDLIDTLQYDTIYAEHLRYYTMWSIAKLLRAHGLYVYKAERIPTHGGSIRVYATKIEHPHSGKREFYINEPMEHELEARLHRFAEQVQFNKTAVLAYLHQVKSQGGKIVGIGAPSRGSTVISYLRLDQSIVEYVCEQSHSLKLGRFMPGSDIPVVDEKRLYAEQPEAAILFSWHLADELIPKLRKNGYYGEIILPCSAEVRLSDTNIPVLV